ncbi:putative ABC transport system permease protein [Nocardioides luteus]|uniref:Membrane protein n=1 Tax=Nocardioides luteus TaxID=1844 RepID=A0ABQ5STK5_9ACTN|nr:FtsX-like permease family protein [Nocardioides luteus]MDR7310117.1 putative ABC transport system permease protein [Nocardioides luteus]GGR64684.1 membrane protein [Nocardioides luteus]GLJ66975.1 membrane protein [Nocardioides luteus]
MLRLTLRNLAAHKVRLLMSTLAIVLGVAFLAGVLTFSHGLDRTFSGIINGSTPDAQVRPANSATDAEAAARPGGGSAASLKPETIERLRTLPEVERADGTVQGSGLYVLDTDDKLINSSGAPTLSFNYTGSPNLLGEPMLELQDGRWPKSTTEVVLDEGTAEKAGYEVGDSVALIVPQGETRRKATLTGTAAFNGGGTAGAQLLVFSTIGAQELFTEGKDLYSGVSLTAAPGVSQKELVEAANTVLPKGFEAITGDKVVAESEDAIGDFLDVISVFLIVFAVIAVIVGAFIIVNTFSILIAQRSRQLALLRALGASRRQITTSVLFEALVMSLVAATIGVLAGWGLAHALAGAFRQAGLEIASDVLVLTPRTIWVSYAVGVAVTLAAALLPSRRAAKVPPVAAMREDTQPPARSTVLRTSVGLVLLLVGLGLAAVPRIGIPEITLPGGFDVPTSPALWVGVGAGISILSVAWISAFLGRPVLAALRTVSGLVFGMTGKLAGQNAMRDPRRTGATASALMIGLALVSLIGVLAASMNASITDVVEEQFKPDLVVQSPTFTPFPTSIGDEMEEVEGVSTISRSQIAQAVLGEVDLQNPKKNDVAFLFGVDEHLSRIYDLEVLEGTDAVKPGQVLVTDEEAEEHGWKLGDRIQLTFASGRQLKPQISGIIARTQVTGNINIRIEDLVSAKVPREDASLSILLSPGADAGAVHERLDELVEDRPVVAVQDKDEFAESIKGQVNQLLYMIYGLLALAIVIAVIGIVNTLGLSVIERTREIGLLRAIGLSRGQLRRMITLESVTIAVLGAVLGLALGVLFGVLLRDALRDDLTSLWVPLDQLATFLGVAVVVGVLAALLPAIRAGREDVLEAIASE